MVNRSLSTIFAVAMATVLMPAAASAQFEYGPLEHPFFSLTYGSASRAQDVREQGRFPLYDEDAAFEVLHSLKRAGFVDVGAGSRAWRSIFFGGAYTFRRKETLSGPITAFIPHPAIYDAFRVADGTVSGLEHTEHAVHVHAMWRVTPSPALQISVFGGPTIFTASHDLVQEFEVQETGSDFGPPTLGEATRTSVSRSGFGAHGGIEAVYRVVRHVGVGVMVRYSRAPGLFTEVGHPMALTVGGLDAGIRIRVGL